MTDSDVVYVAVASQEPLGMDIVEKVSSIVGFDISQTRALINSTIPRIFGIYTTLQAAEEIAGRLRSLGLVALVCDPTLLHQHSSTGFKAHTLQLNEDAVTFWDKHQNSNRVEANSVFLILRGTSRTRVEKETTKTRREFNMPPSVLAATLITAPVTGVIPIAHTVMEKTKEESLKTEDFIRLYDWKSHEPVVEIFQNDFDYSCLEKKKGLLSLENMSIVVNELRRAFPTAIYDERLIGHIRMDEPFAAPGEDIDINCRLIYLYHQATRGTGPRK